MSGSASGSGNASLNVSGTALTTALQAMLMGDDITPGAAPSYALCKTLFIYHPLGQKMAEGPIGAAQSQQRTITVQKGPEELLVEEFEREFQALGCTAAIFNVMSLSRVYGVATLAVGVVGGDQSEPLDMAAVAKGRVYFSVLDPLNSAGSMVTNQDPNSPDFLKVLEVTIAGKPYHPSRVVVAMNENPIYIAYTGSSFGYVGRSVYQRALFPMKSFIQTMRTDDMVARKAGLLIAKIQQQSSIIDGLMRAATAIKRNWLKEGETDNVLSIAPDESVESLNLQNLDGASKEARSNILTNIATAADMPAKMLTQETFAEGFGEGTEDAMVVVRYLNRLRELMAPLYAFMDRIVQHRAWNRDFFARVQRLHPAEYGSMTYEEAFYDWTNSFNAEWPSLVEEKESEAIKVDESKLKAVNDMVTTLLPVCDPENKARLLQWAADNFNANKRLFTSPLVLDWEALATYQAPQPGAMPGQGGGQPGAEGAPQPPQEPAGAAPDAAIGASPPQPAAYPMAAE
ncbi:MAG: anti-CBASS protein Acb1 family protein [Bacteroidia bacterium]